MYVTDFDLEMVIFRVIMTNYDFCSNSVPHRDIRRAATSYHYGHLPERLVLSRCIRKPPVLPVLPVCLLWWSRYVSFNS